MSVKLVSASFCGVRVEKGCTASFKAKIAKAEAWLVSEYDSQRRTSATTESFREWHNIHSIGGFREGAALHGEGEAFDVDYGRNGYGPVRRGRTFGGEAAGDEIKGIRQAAVDVYDRACGGPGKADVDWRRPGESVEECFDRFELVNVATRTYFEPFFNTIDLDGTPLVTIKRRPVKGYATADREAFAGMVGRELRAPLADVPLQVLRDFEAVRVPLVIGTPEERPGKTRNPALGLMNLRRHVVIALVREAGLRWGMDGFGSASGDAMHFDTHRVPYTG